MSPHTNLHTPGTSLSGRIQIGHKSGLFIYFIKCEYKASQASLWLKSCLGLAITFGSIAPSSVCSFKSESSLRHTVEPQFVQGQ